jgi:glycosyltransferase involved in cell wall biosynthesis
VPDARRTSAPRVSVLIGCWNNAGTLPRALDSILAQTVRDLELIVVDDGSTDETPDIVRGIRDPRIRYLPLAHVGISRSLNAGLNEARADAVALQDADDWSLPERLERQLEVLEARPEVAVVGCRMKEVDEDGRELRARFGLATGDVSDKLLRFNPIPNGCAAVRRSAVLSLGGYDPRYRYAMDYDLWLRLAEHHEIVNLPDALAVREMSRSNVAATRDREQVAESIRLKAAALRRRRSLRGAGGIVWPALSFLTPVRLKQATRRLRGQAP